jgi:2-keto-4-pentenoate hydratase
MSATHIGQIANDLMGFHGGGPFERSFDGSIAELTQEEAYAAQDRMNAQREDLGQRPVGYKVGCTSRAIREQIGLAEPICARLMEPHIFWGDMTLRWDNFADCAVEPEFVFKLGQDITENQLSSDSLANAIEFVAPGVEVHRYRFNYGDSSSQELIASNGIHACLVIGDARRSARDIDLDLEGVGLFINDNLAHSGIGADIQGGPLKSLAWLAATLLKKGTHLKAGDLVIPGSATPLIAIQQGVTVESRFTHFGRARTIFS